MAAFLARAGIVRNLVARKPELFQQSLGLYVHFALFVLAGKRFLPLLAAVERRKRCPRLNDQRIGRDVLRVETQHLFEALAPLVQRLVRNAAHQIDVDVVKMRRPRELVAVEEIVVAVNSPEQF